jgi:hypothetical protein
VAVSPLLSGPLHFQQQETVPMSKHVAVRLKRSYKLNNEGEVASFPASEAEALISSGLAEAWPAPGAPQLPDAPPADRAMKSEAVVKRDVAPAPAPKAWKK